MNSKTAVKRSDDPSLRIGLRLLGLSASICWAYSLFLRLLPVFKFNEGSVVSQVELILPATVFLGIACGLLICFLLANRFRLVFCKTGLVLSCIFVATFTAAFFLNNSISTPIFIFLGFMASASTGFLFVCWLILISRSATDQTGFLYSLSFAFGILMGFLFTSFPAPIRDLSFFLSFVFSAGIHFFLAKRSGAEEHIDRKTSRLRRPLFWKTHVTFGIFGLAFGLCMFELVEQKAPLSGVTVALLGGVVIAVIDVWQAGGVYTDRMRKLNTAIMLAALLAASFLTGEYQNACWYVIVSLFAYFFIIQPNWSIIAGNKYRLNLASLVPEGQAHIWITMAIGWILGCLVRLYEVNIMILLLGLVMLLVVATLLYKVDDFADLKHIATETNFFDGGEVKPKRFMERCENAAKQFCLTPRETEVLILLAKGRNAEYICNTLIISMHTVKTHIYHIYQKMEVGSQQALMDKIETLK